MNDYYVVSLHREGRRDGGELSADYVLIIQHGIFDNLPNDSDRFTITGRERQALRFTVYRSGNVSRSYFEPDFDDHQFYRDGFDFKYRVRTSSSLPEMLELRWNAERQHVVFRVSLQFVPDE
jgi:hypothetical protein